MNNPIQGILLEAVKTASGLSRLIDDLELTKLCMEEVSDDIEITNSEIREIILTMNDQEEFTLCVFTGKERLRCFDSTIMSLSYAKALNLGAEGDIFETIASTVRNESRQYPRPTMIDMFRHPPYNLEPEILEHTVEAILKDHSEFKDICRSSASNGDIYLYSNRYINKSRADYLSEWESVGSLESQ
ncbi:hypothetical protein EXM22_00965 [Oceanispirochaeta crateris]|uniref:Uncharacterized protein n=1 Tax=Oceanispirochaeta crateris TaxID=2518645 RepID=A0A5C1QGP6_9SPIO|nr:hypothetical protein [Oceanispirochaeta crateris]QEN06627.1 hypothetical protein EXM22_00965 [Oceanispirochaeta crateris]